MYANTAKNDVLCCSVRILLEKMRCDFIRIALYVVYRYFDAINGNRVVSMVAMTKNPKGILNAMVFHNAKMVEVVNVNDVDLVVGHGKLCKLL